MLLFIVIVLVVALIATLVVGKMQILQGKDNTFFTGFYDGFMKNLLNSLFGGK